MASKPRRQEIVMDLHTGKRDPVDDADHVHTNDSMEQVSFIHEADSGSVNINFTYEDATECVPAGGVTADYDFDITAEHINNE